MLHYCSYYSVLVDGCVVLCSTVVLQYETAAVYEYSRVMSYNARSNRPACRECGWNGGSCYGREGGERKKKREPPTVRRHTGKRNARIFLLYSAPEKPRVRTRAHARSPSCIVLYKNGISSLTLHRVLLQYRVSSTVMAIMCSVYTAYSV